MEKRIPVPLPNSTDVSVRTRSMADLLEDDLLLDFSGASLKWNWNRTQSEIKALSTSTIQVLFPPNNQESIYRACCLKAVVESVRVSSIATHLVDRKQNCLQLETSKIQHTWYE